MSCGRLLFVSSSPKTSRTRQVPKPWTFLTNHAHVLLCLAREPEGLLRDVAVEVGITERAVQRIVRDLEAEGYLHRKKEGRRNHYVMAEPKPLRHPIEAHRTTGDLLALIRR
ncbi:MAG: helix-turn-helix domain-containing protein [Myxococcales bacterium]|nr:helix-turn-helix domain-containing protein [Myxococcales bacterium]